MGVEVGSPSQQSQVDPEPTVPREPWVCQADLRDLKVCLEKDPVHVNQQLRLCQSRIVLLFTP